MKKSSNVILFSIVLVGLNSRSSSALIDCSTPTIGNRIKDDFTSDHVAACAHFKGVNHEPYLAWYEDSEVFLNYPNQVYLQGSDPARPEDGTAVHWKVDNEHVYIAVAARATGWLGFGISEAGGMTGTDMVLFTASQPEKLVDAYTGDKRVPQIDDCESDWELVSSNVDTIGGFIMFEAKRSLNTNDPQDKPIVDDASTLVPAHRVIAAWGDSEEVGYHGLNRARGSIRFYGVGDETATFQAAMGRNSEGSVDLQALSYTVPEEATIYKRFCFSRQDLINQGLDDTNEPLNIVGWEPLVEAGNEAYVHHYVVMGSTQPFCSNTTDDDMFNEMVYVWAPGEEGVAFPDFLGAPLFGANGFQAFEVEIHYNNPTLQQGIIDNSGVRLYWTSEQKQQQIGIMSIGDPLIGAFGQPVGQGISRHVFECPASCSNLIGQEVTVLREYLHMHEVGLRITNEQIREGEVIRSGNVEHWEFDQNGNAAVQQGEFVVQPGDSFRTTCYYDDPEGTRTFGLASSEEMCMAFLYYYPRQVMSLGPGIELSWFCGHNIGFEACDASYEKASIESTDKIGREYAVPNEQCVGVPDVDPDVDPDVGPDVVPNADPDVDAANMDSASSKQRLSTVTAAAVMLVVLFA